MNQLNKQVTQAKRRLNLQHFISVVFWFLFAALSVAAVGIAIRKIWVIPADPMIWQWSWIAGSLAVGFVAAVVYCALRRHDTLDAAIEIDKRFGLKERVSSCLSLTDQERETEVGQALIDDAVRRASIVDVGQEFKVTPNRWAWLPCAMAAVVFALTFLSDAQPDPAKQATASIVPISKKVKNSTKDLRKKIAERKKKALEEGLDDAGELFKKLEMGVEDLSKKNKVDKKETLVKLNDLAKEIKRRQQQLGSPDQLRKQLDQLKDIKQGPADKMAKALNKGDFKAAMDAVAEMQKQLMNDSMSKQDKEKLAQQLGQLKDKIQEMADAREQMKQDLKRQIQQKMAQGDQKAATEMQKKLDQMNQQSQQMQQMQKMAQQMADAQKAMKEGDNQKAAQQLAELSESIQSMAQEMDEMEMLDDALEQFAQAKDSMNCESCNGSGCSMCQGDGDSMGNGMGMGMGMGDMPGMGLGQGRGQGDRPEQESATDTYDSQVRAKPGRGKAVVTGKAGGANRAGQSLIEIKNEIASAKSSDDDPLTGVRLPKAQRNLTKEYFERFRKGE